MSINIRLPNVTAPSDSGKLAQMQSYLYQMVEQLNWALNNIETVGGGGAAQTIKVLQSEDISQEEALDTFNAIKALIIKSADIVMAYEKTIISNFEGKYFAQSDFGTYLEETSRKIEENSKGTRETYERVETIDTDITELKEYVRTTNGYIHRGILPDGRIGIEVGETTENGSFIKYARFVSDRLSFFDAYGSEVAYIGAGCLYILGKAVFNGEIHLGGYKTDTTDGLAFTWIGG